MTDLKGLKKLVDKELKRHLCSRERDLRGLYDAMRYSLFSGGKRLRPILLIESCKACGGSTKSALPAACAVELVHTYSLIHDDLPSMDDDDYRRGKPTCHKVFGEANAILAGDALLTLAFNIIADQVSPVKGARMTKTLSDAIGANGMVGGQAVDLAYKDRAKTGAVLRRINGLKTAKLFEASTSLGAIAAGRPIRDVEAMRSFGYLFGMSFQIVDDILDGGDSAKALGMARARDEAKALVKRSHESLKIFGRRAQRLKEIADHVLTREK